MAITNKLYPTFLVAMIATVALFLSLTASPAVAQQAEMAATYQTTRTAHKVSGWEHGLIKKSPNLGKYYWTPLTEYSQSKGSYRTGKGVQQRQSSAQSTQLTRHYVKPRFAPLPKNDRAEFSAGEIQSRSEVSARVRFYKAKNQLASRPDSSNECAGVLTYGDKEKGDGYSYKRQALSVSGRLYGRKK